MTQGLRDPQRELFSLPRIAPPSVPVGSSERGAERAKPKQGSQQWRILNALAAAGCFPNSGKYLSRDDLIDRAELTINAACGRLGPSGALVVKQKDYRPGCAAYVVSVDDAATSADGNSVLGYQLTDLGQRYLAERKAA
jgi:hypothetical protein